MQGLSFLGKFYSKSRNKQLKHVNLFNDLEWKTRLERLSLNIIYKQYYLSHKDIFEWDKISILLRIAKPLNFIHRILINKFSRRIKQMLSVKDNSDIGAGLLIVAQKIIS